MARAAKATLLGLVLGLVMVALARLRHSPRSLSRSRPLGESFADV